MGKPTFTVNGKNIVILQEFRVARARLLPGCAAEGPAKKLLVQLGQVQAGRVMKFTSVKQIIASAATIRTYVREAIAVERRALQSRTAKTSDVPLLKNSPTACGRIRDSSVPSRR